jgi:hypothetical protein
MGRAVDRACRGSEVPFRAFWREPTVRFGGNACNFRMQLIGVQGEVCLLRRLL